MTRTLYEITADLILLNDALDAAEGDLSKMPDADRLLANVLDQMTFCAQMDELAEDRAKKLDAYVNLIRETRMRQARARAEIEQWAKKNAALEARADYLESRLKDHLIALGERSARTASGRLVSVHGNGGAHPIKWADLVTTEQVKQVAPDCVMTTERIDTAAVRRLLEAGATLSFATLQERGTHLRIT